VEELAALPRWENRQRVTYHDPCHLKTQGITREPRALLRALPNVELIEMEGADLCCGLGGTFSVSHYKESQAIGAAKLPGLEGQRGREGGHRLPRLHHPAPGCHQPRRIACRGGSSA
jgi:Fe-S oxidoreductase